MPQIRPYRCTVRAAIQSHRFLARRGWVLDRMATFSDDGETDTTALLTLDLT